MRALESLPRSKVLRRVLPRLVPNIIACTITTLAYTAFHDLYPDKNFGVSALPHSFVATLLSLTLVFRSNASYAKYDEGRKLWGRLINSSRAFGRLACASLPPQHAKVVASLAVLFPYALMDHLYEHRSEQPYCRVLDDVVIPDELRSRSILINHIPTVPAVSLDNENGTSLRTTVMESSLISADAPALLDKNEICARVNAANNKPLEVIVHLGIAVRAAMNRKEELESRLNGYPTMTIAVERQMMEQMMSDLIDILGSSERIVKTPIPLSWTRHASRLASIWTLTLPLVLAPLEGLFCVPTVAAISWAMFSIEGTFAVPYLF